MICPYCQTDLESRDLACPRCGAPLPNHALAFGFNLRMVAVTGFLLVMLALILATCIVPRLSQTSSSAHVYPPDEVRRALENLAHHEQGNENPAPQPFQK